MLARTLTIYHLQKEGINMEKHLFETFLKDPQADIGTGLLATRGFGFCFILKQSSRWGKNENGTPTLPFGGIGGKLEKDELPSQSLHREAQEEVGSDVEIIGSGERAILMDANSIQIISLSTQLKDEPLPIIIFRSPKQEEGRKPFTNVLIYMGEFSSQQLKPLDDPALIELSKELLIRIAKEPMTIAEFQKAGGQITSRIELPAEGILKPIGTAIAAARCLEQGTVDKVISPERRLMSLWEKF